LVLREPARALGEPFLVAQVQQRVDGVQVLAVGVLDRSSTRLPSIPAIRG
jgi:hypothetical protein